MSDAGAHEGSCFCGAVRIKVSGAPAAMGYCHCASCRHWSAGPVNGFTLWPPAQVEVTAGADKIRSYAKNPSSERQWCADCGGHLMTNHPGMGLVDVYSALIPSLDFQPKLHVHYGAKVLSVKDGLPKFKDMPAEMGGSGDVVAD